MENGLAITIRKFVAPEFVFGAGARQLVGRYARNFGATKVLVVTDAGVIAAGWARDVTQSLDAAGIESIVFSSVSPNPRAAEVMAGAELALRERCDVIVAVGGGSPIDCAKGIGIVVSNGGDVLDYVGVDRIEAPMPPLICVPTTAGSSADVSQFAIITDPARATKFAIISKALVPDISLIDPVTLTTMAPELTAQTGVDALVHAIEAFVSSAHSGVTDVHALEAVRLLSTNLEASQREPQDVKLRSEVMQASLQAGLAFSNASLGAVHALAHSLGGLLDLPHGEANSLLLEHVVAFNYPEAAERYRKIAEVLGLGARSMSSAQVRRAILQEIHQLRERLGLAVRLRDRGVHASDVHELAEKALHDPCIVTNPRRPNLRDLEVIYEEAL